MIYDEPVPEYGDVFTVEVFKELCKFGSFIDYDGDGEPGKVMEEGMILMGRQRIKPSSLQEIPGDATHIVWFNR